MKPRVTLYTRAGCCLCDAAKSVVLAAARRVNFEYEERDIDTDEALRRLYNEEVPVIAIDGANVFRHEVDLEALLRRLAPGARLS